MMESLLTRGDRVVATVWHADVLGELGLGYGDRLRIVVVDLTDIDAMRRGVDAACATMGRIDVVVSNAAYGLFAAIEEVSDAQIARSPRT